MEMGSEEQPDSREIRTAMWTNRFIVPLNFSIYSAISCFATTPPFQVALSRAINFTAPIAAASRVQGLWSTGAGSIHQGA